MNKFLKIFIIALVFVQIALAAIYLLKGDIVFHTDIARDFLLLDEIALKKIMLIGPRASGLNGLFHGPLWLYLNFPAYLFGRGNPVVVGWWWLILSIIFLTSFFIFAKKLFNEKTAFLSLIFTSNILLPASNGLFNPFGAMFIFPLFFYSIYKYSKISSLKYLLLSLFLCGLLVQFQLAFGLPILLLTGLLVLYLVFKKKKYLHLLAFFILLIPLSSFIIFDIRHNFSQLHSIADYFTGKIKYEKVSWIIMIQSRLDVMFYGMIDITKGFFNKFNALAIIFLSYSYWRLLKTKNSDKSLFNLFFYYFIGFFILSFTHNGWLLYYYYSPFIPLCIMFFCGAVVANKNRLLFIIVLCIAIFGYTQSTKIMISNFKNIGNTLSSWKFLNSVASKIYDNAPSEFGLYIYTPDILAYQAKYAISYAKKNHTDKFMAINEKRAVTYVIEEPAPKDRPDMDGKWWITNRIKINKIPDEIIKFDNNYLIKKFLLSSQEIKIPSDPIINDWITMR